MRAHPTAALCLLCTFLAIGTAAAQSNPGQSDNFDIEALNAAMNRLGGAAGGGATPQAVADTLLPSLGQAMGLEPKHKVSVVFHDAASLQKLLLDAMSRQYPGDAFDRMEQAYRLIGLSPPAISLRAEVLQTLQGAIAGTYDPFTGQMALVQGTPSERTHELLQHELAHALQDQYFHLKDLIRRAAVDEDRALALQGVIEGQAVVAMFSGASPVQEDAAAHPNETRAQKIDRARADLKAAGVTVSEGELEWMVDGGGEPGAKTSWSNLMPQENQIPSQVPWLRAQTAFPYQEGTRFIEKLLESSSLAAVVTTTFGMLPVSTRQILHPEAYVARIAPTPVSLAGIAGLAGWHVVYKNTIGELNVRTLFGGAGKGDRVAAGWAGDGIVGVASPGCEMAVAWVSAWDTAEDANEFATAMTRSFLERDGAKQISAGKVELQGRLFHVLRMKSRVAVLAGVPASQDALFLQHVWE